jgi:NAD dependent epimerase/dehydratase
MEDLLDSSVNWNQKTVLVTGAGGFIGSHLTERLVALGSQTRALIHYNSAGSWGWLDSSPLKNDIEVFLGDVQDRDSLRAAVKGVDIVFHLAALIAIPYSYHAPISYVRTNVEGTLNVLQASLDAGVHLVVQTSTSEVYGTARQIPIGEDHPLQGQSPYAASKIGADQMAQAFHRSFGLPVATIRPFNTFGPHQSARAVIPTIITQALKGSEVRLGTLEPTRDFNYVADIVEGFVKMADCPEAVGQVVNIGSGQEISIGDLAAMVLELVGVDVPVLSDSERLRPDNSEVDRLCADNRKAQQILGWSPQYTLREGLALSIEWIEQNIERYRVGTYTI